MEQKTEKLPTLAVRLLPEKPTAKARGALGCSDKLRGVPAMLWICAASQHSQNSQLLPNFTYTVLLLFFFFFFYPDKGSLQVSVPGCKIAQKG